MLCKQGGVQLCVAMESDQQHIVCPMGLGLLIWYSALKSCDTSQDGGGDWVSLYGLKLEIAQQGILERSNA